MQYRSRLGESGDSGPSQNDDACSEVAENDATRHRLRTNARERLL